MSVPTKPCPVCRGEREVTFLYKGKFVKKQCKNCRGKGRVAK